MALWDLKTRRTRYAWRACEGGVLGVREWGEGRGLLTYVVRTHFVLSSGRREGRGLTAWLDLGDGQARTRQRDSFFRFSFFLLHHHRLYHHGSPRLFYTTSYSLSLTRRIITTATGLVDADQRDELLSNERTGAPSACICGGEEGKGTSGRRERSGG